MSKTELAPFLKWGSYKSQDQTNPDLLELKVLEEGTFQTAYSINTKVLQKVGTRWNEVILPLKSNDSNNGSLLKAWLEKKKQGAISPGKKFHLKTWLGTSKLGRPIRRFVLE